MRKKKKKLIKIVWRWFTKINWFIINIDYSKRSNIDEIIKIVYINIGTLFFDKIIDIFNSDKSYQNYIIERNIQNSLDKLI